MLFRSGDKSAENTLATQLRRRFSAQALLPVLYGCSGLVDVTTIERVLESGGRARG